MKYTFFTVGPSHTYPTVPLHTRNALANNIFSISHRGNEAKAIIKKATDGVRQILRVPPHYHIFFTASSLESMERIIQNTVFSYSFHFLIGEFSRKFYDIAQQLGKKPAQITLDLTKPWKISEIDIPKRTEVICITQNETSTGVAMPSDELQKLKKMHPDALVAVDIVSAVPCVTIDISAVDMAFFSVQKGFGLPSGLGVIIVSPKALAKAHTMHKKGRILGSYHSFLSLTKAAQKQQTPETPNLFAIYLLGQVIHDMRQYGLRKIKQETEQKAQLLYEFFDSHQSFQPFIKLKQHRSLTTIVIDVQGKTQELLPKLEKKGFIIGSGYGPFKDDHIRIANFPAHTMSRVKALLRELS